MCASFSFQSGDRFSNPSTEVRQPETIRSYGWERRGGDTFFLVSIGEPFHDPLFGESTNPKILGVMVTYSSCVSCSFQRGNSFSIPRSESPPKRKHSPANHNLYSDEVLKEGNQRTHTGVYPQNPYRSRQPKNDGCIEPLLFCNSEPASFPPYPQYILMFRIAAVKPTSPTEERRVEPRIVSVKNTGKKLFLHKVT